MYYLSAKRTTRQLKKRLSIIVLLVICLSLGSVLSIQVVTAQTTETQSSLFGVPSPEIVINKTKFSPGEKVEITVQEIPPFSPNTDPRLELYMYLPFLQKIGENVPLNCLGESCIVVYSFDELRKGETDPKAISFVLFSQKNPKPIIESGWMNSVCDLKFNGETMERYGEICNSLDLPPGIYEIKFGWGIEISDKFEIVKTIPITIQEASSDIVDSKNQILDKTSEDTVNKATETKEATDSSDVRIEQNPVEKEAKPVQEIDEITSNGNEGGGGCLIATAAYGTELAPQVQFLREIRDNTVMSTASGTAFMAGFNHLYYSFSPTIADMERQNPAFKEIVKIGITPLITSLSLLNYVDVNSEQVLIWYGIILILLNVGMYIVAPAIVIIKIGKNIVTKII